MVPKILKELKSHPILKNLRIGQIRDNAVSRPEVDCYEIISGDIARECWNILPEL